MRKLYMTNSAGRDATVRVNSPSVAPSPKMGVPGTPLTFKKYLSATADGLHSSLSQSLEEDYGQALIDADPEVDIEQVGRFIGGTNSVYLSSEKEVLYAAPETIEILLNADGSEKERRSPQDVEANVADELPVRWTGKKIPKAQAVTKFVFKRSLQVRHVDGLTFDYLYAIAKELSDENSLMLVGGGSSGKDPLIFQANGTPYRAFLEGRIDGQKYQLLLHLSNMELTRPE